MLDKGTCLRFYKRRDIQEAMVQHAKDKEVGVRFGNGFGKRPDILTYPQDVLELAKNGVTSFHASEEIWSNPLAISSDLSRKELEELRKGWDLVLDIDCVVMEYSRICADLVVKFLEYCGVKDFSCKFSGNKGFHLGVPFEAFPKKVGDKETCDLFPDAPRKIAAYITENIKEELARRILAFENNEISRIREKVNLPPEEIVVYEQEIPRLQVDKFLEIDTILISSRHLYRMPYSLHEKSGLVSLPIDPQRVMEFEKPLAEPDKILTPMFKFLERDVSGETGRRLLLQALDFEVKLQEEREEHKTFEEIQIESPITEDFFPPCIKKILKGMEDGKKRGIFVLMNFLGKVGWSKEEINAYLKKWNKEKNPEPLREVYLNGQMHSFKAGDKLPPNCDNEGYYKGLNVCEPDGLCQKIKNPVNYTVLRWRQWLRFKEEDEQKNSRKKKQDAEEGEINPSKMNPSEKNANEKIVERDDV